MKSEVDKPDINKLVDVLTGFNNFKTKVDNLDINKLKTVPVDLKKSDVLSKGVVKNTKFNKLNTEIPDAFTLIQTNRFNTDKQNLEKEIRDVDKQLLGVSSLVTSTVLNTKIGEVKNKIPDLNGLVTIAVLKTKIREVENNILGVSDLVKKTDHNAKISDTEAKYFTTSDYDKYMGQIRDTKLSKRV